MSDNFIFTPFDDCWHVGTGYAYYMAIVARATLGPMPRADGTLYNYERAKLPPAIVQTDPPEKPVTKKTRATMRYAPAKVGRPVSVKLTPEALEKAVKAVEGGLPVSSALILQGLNKDSVQHFLKMNPAIAKQFAQADTKFEHEMVQLVRLHALKDGKNAQWLLERRVGGSYVPVNRQEITGKNGAAIQQMTLSKTLLATVAASGDGLERAKPVKNQEKSGAVDI